jgi:MFS family permease
MPSTNGPNPSTPAGSAAMPGARSALILLLAINLFNYIDRQVLAAVEPEIRKELLTGGADDKAKMGLLSTAFLFSYMLTAPLFGLLADRLSRWLLVGIGVIIWSLASGASGWNWHLAEPGALHGLAAAYWALFITRCFVGIGEGAYGPIAPAMIADLYPVKRRGQVLALFYLAIPVGGALGYALGEVVQGLWGWRWAFFVVVPPGLALGLCCFLMKDPPRGQTERTTVSKAKIGVREYFSVLAIPSYLLNTLGMTAMTFAIGGLAYWMPAFLEEQSLPAFGANTVSLLGAPQGQGPLLAASSLYPGRAEQYAPGLGPIGPRTLFGIITALAGLVATIAGGLAGDWLKPRYPGSYFLVSGIAMLLGFPMVLGFVYTPFPWAWIFVFCAVFCLFFNTGPTNTILANVTHPSIRASAFALNILIIHAFGDAVSPPVIGFIAGRSTLRVGFIVVSLLMLVGGVLWLWGARYLEKDTALAPTRM